ncbi:hypothetical protein IKF15_01865 [Candidatus Saccharibacteria bacterium]|nr:hypothetical protein [Candidatus Saccharibacteria bacterium]
MSDILCLATIMLAGVAQASLQLSLGGLILLYHSSMGHHRKKKTRRLTRSYILGAGAISFLMVSASCYLISEFLRGELSTAWLATLIGVLIASAVVMWVLYYKKGRSTELWLPKAISRFIHRRARRTEDGVEAFSLGMLSAFAEMPMSIALYLVVANCVLNLSSGHVLAILGYVVIVCLPMLILKGQVRLGKSAVAVQKWRVQNKQFGRLYAGSSFVVLGMFLLAFWVM